MKLYYYDKEYNFGDQLNGWIWERALPGVWTGDGPVFTGIGTIINSRLPSSGHTIIFSSGAGYGALSMEHLKRLDIVCVRGPLSARVLGLAPEAAVTDGAALLASFPEFVPLPASQRDGIVFMPHHKATGQTSLKMACEKAGLEFLSPCLDSRATVERIRSAKLVIADAMHAAIVADAMRVPWVPVVTSRRISTFKWLDWAASLDMAYEPSILPPAGAADAACDAMLPLTGQDHYFSERSFDAAIANFVRVSRRATGRRRTWMRRKCAHVQGHLLYRLNSEPCERWLAPMNRRMVDRVADHLANAASRIPFLSAEAVFKARVRELLDRLDIAKTIAAQPVRSTPGGAQVVTQTVNTGKHPLPVWPEPVVP